MHSCFVIALYSPRNAEVFNDLSYTTLPTCRARDMVDTYPCSVSTFSISKTQPEEEITLRNINNATFNGGYLLP
ncbi:hypothetical protein HZ326_15462 [Fusarium oxysporum f. sp. albedinis]|nr:hypothetical protein HZ326_15462 [Fusarium oxysporum f. sp. albedinis]